MRPGLGLGEPGGDGAEVCPEGTGEDRSGEVGAGAGAEEAPDHLIFAGGSAAIRDVMVGGRWVIKDGRHALADSLAGPFRDLMRSLPRS